MGPEERRRGPAWSRHGPLIPVIVLARGRDQGSEWNRQAVGPHSDPQLSPNTHLTSRDSARPCPSAHPPGNQAFRLAQAPPFPGTYSPLGSASRESQPTPEIPRPGIEPRAPPEAPPPSQATPPTTQPSTHKANASCPPWHQRAHVVFPAQEGDHRDVQLLQHAWRGCAGAQAAPAHGQALGALGQRLALLGQRSQRHLLAQGGWPVQLQKRRCEASSPPATLGT